MRSILKQNWDWKSKVTKMTILETVVVKVGTLGSSASKFGGHWKPILRNRSIEETSFAPSSFVSVYSGVGSQRVTAGSQRRCYNEGSGA